MTFPPAAVIRARIGDIPRIAWLAAITAATHRPTGGGRQSVTAAHRRTAFLTLPVHGVTAAMYVMAGQAFVDPSREVMIYLQRSGLNAAALKRHATGLILTLAVLVPSLLLMVLAFQADSMAVRLLAVCVLALVAATAFTASVLVSRQDTSATQAQLELLLNPPVRPYWNVQGLMRHPESRVDGLAFARDVVESQIPAGEAIALVAADARLARAYRRWGLAPARAGSQIMVGRAP